MPWFVLFLAGLCEIGWAIGLKYTYGFSKFWPSVSTVALMILSYVLLAQALKSLPLGNAYAIWTGIGAIGAAIGGVYLFGESMDGLRLFCIGLIVTGVLGLRFAGGN